MPKETESVRAMAGLLLKNNIRGTARIQPAVVEFIKEAAILGLGDPIPLVRGTLGIVITTLVTKHGLATWPELLPRLVELISSPDAAAIEVRSRIMTALTPGRARSTPKAD